MTLVNIVILSIVGYWLYVIWCVGYCYSIWKGNSKAAKAPQNSVIEILQDKTTKFFNEFDISEIDMCAHALSEHIEINSLKYFYEITVILDADGSKEIRVIDIKLKRE